MHCTAKDLFVSFEQLGIRRETCHAKTDKDASLWEFAGSVSRWAPFTLVHKVS